MEQEIFTALRDILQPYEPKMNVVHDTDDDYYLDCKKEVRKDMPMFFASVRKNKDDVRFQLMPLYAFPELLKGMTPELRLRMQGKSSFNFTQAEQALFDELRDVTARGYELFRKKGYAE